MMYYIHIKICTKLCNFPINECSKWKQKTPMHKNAFTRFSLLTSYGSVEMGSGPTSLC